MQRPTRAFDEQRNCRAGWCPVGQKDNGNALQPLVMPYQSMVSMSAYAGRATDTSAKGGAQMWKLRR